MYIFFKTLSLRLSDYLAVFSKAAIFGVAPLSLIFFVVLPVSSMSLDNDSQTSSKIMALDVESHPLIADLLYARPTSTYQLMDNNGAYKSNTQYVLGHTNNWYIEEQRFGLDAILAGVLHGDSQSLSAGFKMFDWGFSQQLSDGSFAGTGDPFHSTSIFVQSVAYGLLTLQDSSSPQYEAASDRYFLGLHNAARWMLQDDIWARGLNNNSPYSHRNYFVGAALSLTGKLTNDSGLIDYGNTLISDGLTLQRSNGVNPEKNGHDSSYQMAGALAAMRWLAHFATDPLAHGVTEMINRALLWEESMILASGEISTEGNTRTGGGENTRSDSIKRVNHREIVHGFAYWSAMTNDVRWHQNAHTIAHYYYSHDSKLAGVLERDRTVLDQYIVAAVTPSQPAQTVPEPSSLIALTIVGMAHVLRQCCGAWSAQQHR